MKVMVFGGYPGWHVQDLLRAAEELQLHLLLHDFRSVSGLLPVANKPNAKFAIVRSMPMGSLEQVLFRMNYLWQLQAQGVRIFNTPRALEICIDKYLTFVQLQPYGLPIPKTAVCQTADQAMGFFHELAENVVVKPIFGSEGRGLIHVHDAEIAWRVFTAIERTQSVLYLQEYIPHTGWDLRLLVLNGRVIARMKRQNPEDWRTNVARGAKTEQYQSHEQDTFALKACAVLGVFFAGVDLIQRPNGEWLLLEVNAVPGWKGISAVCQLDVAKLFLEGILQQQENQPE